MSERGLKVVEGKRSRKSNNETRVINNKENTNKVANAIADNFGSILDLAYDIVETNKIKVQTDAIISKMKEDRETLLAEAEVYAKKKNADTKSIVERMRVIQEMMRDFYQYNNSSMSGDEFSKVVSEIVTQMGRID